MTIWTPKTQQAETWRVEGKRVFDPAVFNHKPIFDTWSTAGLEWNARAKQAETWTNA